MKITVKARYNIRFLLYLVPIVLILMSGTAMASGQTIGTMAEHIVESFESLAKLITASSYLGGLGFSIGAIMKFKQHKDNPTQIPVGTPIAMLFIASALLFLPSILSMTGDTMFDDAQTAGPGGIIFGVD
jgi:intracellular multiplication protein IcmD